MAQVDRKCILCGEEYFIDNDDTIPFCHNCYLTLFDTMKPLEEKVKYLASFTGLQKKE